jgi:putative component of membrane protein insertase Oxa1/YidC/SpoIIIJ protein YidD
MRRSRRFGYIAVLLASVGRWGASATTLSDDFSLLVPPAVRSEGSPDRVVPDTRETSEWKLVALGSIRLYQVLLSSQSGRVCNFTPSCSRFAQDAIGRFGLRGVLLASDRLQRCHPFAIDLYPEDPATGKRVDPVDAYDLGPPHRVPLRGLLAPGTVSEGAPTSAGRPDAEEKGRSPEDASGVRSVRLFADHLAHEGDWLRAATEYRRCLFEMRDPASSDTLLLLIAGCLRRGGEPDRAASVLLEVLDDGRDEGLDRIAAREIALTYYASGRHGDGASFLDGLRVARPALFVECGGDHLLGIGSLLEGEWAEAREHFASRPPGNEWPDSNVVRSLDRIGEEGTGLDRKNPILAASFSLVVPGTGKAYAGRYRDGLYSLATVGIMLWQAIEGFSDDGTDSGRGWIYGGLSAAFYFGNVYGSAMAAKQHNETSEGELKERAATIAFSVRFP